MAETKTKAFRADTETIAKIDKWLDEMGLRNADALPAILDLIEMSGQKAKLPGRAADIENFQSLTQQLESAYVASLELASNAENTVKQELGARINAAQHTIETLQESIDKLKADAKKSAELEKRTASAEKHAAELQSALADKTALIGVLQEQKATAGHAKEEAISQLKAMEKQLKEREAACLATVKGAEEAAKKSIEQAEGRYQERLEVETQKIRNDADKRINAAERAALEAERNAATKIDALQKELEQMKAKTVPTKKD